MLPYGVRTFLQFPNKIREPAIRRPTFFAKILQLIQNTSIYFPNNPISVKKSKIISKIRDLDLHLRDGISIFVF